MDLKDDLGYKRRVKYKSKRPLLLTLLCIGFVFYGFADIIFSYVHLYTGMSVFYPAFNSLMVVLGFVAISGIWSMEKWGPVSFSIVSFLKLITDLIFSELEWYLILWFVLAGLFFLYFSKMRSTR
jgi:hypothetical protein